MRTLQPATHENRKRKLLQAVIYHYVRTAKPVGSHMIVDQYNFGMSSATVRHLLADLEKEGYLVQPHTSAGRVPTDKGYRFYVDSLLEIQTLATAEEERIRKGCEKQTKELEDLMVSTSQMLSALSHYTGVVLSPRMDKSLLRHLHLIPLDGPPRGEPRQFSGGNQILVVVVSQTGVIRHRVISLPRPIETRRLAAISDLLNERLAGIPLSEVRTQILDHIEAAEQEHEEMFSLAKDLAREAFDLEIPETEVYVNGQENIFSLPDFQDYTQLTNLLKVVEQKNLLTSVMEKTMKKRGLSVKIGSENKLPGLRGVSLVSSTYQVNNNTVGVLGILGPRRMEYGRMMALVESVARIVSETLAHLNVSLE